MYNMNILFIDRNFPGQFENLVTELAKNPEHTVTFITNTAKNKIAGVNTVIYNTPKNLSRTCTLWAKSLEDASFHGEFAANAATTLLNKGVIPDIIIGKATGASMFIKDVFKDVPYLCYFDEFHNVGNLDLTDIQKMALKCQNSNILADLVSCDVGITPSDEQKNQFPKEFQHKIKVLQIEEYSDFVDSLINKKELA